MSTREARNERSDRSMGGAHERPPPEPDRQTPRPSHPDSPGSADDPRGSPEYEAARTVRGGATMSSKIGGSFSDLRRAPTAVHLPCCKNGCGEKIGRAHV